MPGVTFKYFIDTSFLEQAPIFNEDTHEYLMGQQERCPTTGRLHWQFCGAFKKRLSMKTAKTMLPIGCHIEPSKSLAVEQYVHKDETSIPETRFCYGNRPLKRNSAKDWVLIKSQAKAGLLDEIPPDLYIRSYRTLKQIATDHIKIVDRNIKVLLFYGQPGMGKSYKAREMFPNAYWKVASNIWWDSYNGEKEVIIDDVCDGIGPMHFKRWLDKTPCLLQIKGGTVPALFETVVITSNYHVEEWWQKARQTDIKAIGSRINETWTFYRENNTLVIGKRINETRKKWWENSREQIELI